MWNEYEFTDRAMGTEIAVSIVCTDAIFANTIYANALHTLRAYEERFSRFLPNSEVSLLNERRSLQVSPTFFDVLTEMRNLYRETGGAFNPLVQVSRIGYNKSFESVTSEQTTPEDVYTIDFEATHLEPHTRWVQLAKGQKIDVGGFLKGYLAEKIAKSCSAQPEVRGVIVNLGGDLHTCGYDKLDIPFVFSIFNPVPGHTPISLTLTNESLATSGTYKRVWKYKGLSQHHILDISGERNPETDIISASVIHANGGKAEAYTKAFLSLGEIETRKILKDQHLRYVLIHTDGSVNTHIQ